MPKQKTHKGLKSRVRITRNGKIVRRKAGKSHLMSSIRGKRSRQLRRPCSIGGEYAKTITRKLAGG